MKRSGAVSRVCDKGSMGSLLAMLVALGLPATTSAAEPPAGPPTQADASNKPSAPADGTAPASPRPNQPQAPGANQPAGKGAGDDRGAASQAGGGETAAQASLDDSAVEAASETTDALDQLDLSELLNMNVTSSVATKLPTTGLNTPSSVTVFTRADIHRLNIRNLEELLNYVPGFQAATENYIVSTRISARGRSTASSESFLITIDGQRLNDHVYGGATTFNRFIAIENVKQVEIIRGPGSALYGSNAFLGVINLVTEKDKSDISAMLGSTSMAQIASNVALKIKEAKVAAFLKYVTDGGYWFPGAQDMSGRVAPTRDPRTGLDLYLSAEQAGFNFAMRHSTRHLPENVPLGLINNARLYEDTRVDSAQLSYGIKVADTARLTLKGYGSVGQNRGWSQIDRLTMPTLTQDMTLAPERQTYSIGTQVDYEWTLHPTNTLVAGTLYEFFRQDKVWEYANYNPSTGEFINGIATMTGSNSLNKEGNRYIFGAYAQDRQVLGPVSLTAGARYDWYDSFGSSINPRGAVIYETPINSAIKLMYGRAFRAPTYNELYSRNQPLVTGDPNLKPETIDTFEAAYLQNLKFLTGGVTLFHNRIRDIITAAPAPSAANAGQQTSAGTQPTLVFQNLGKSNVTGLEFEVRVAPVERLLLQGTYTALLDGDDGKMPKNMASAGAHYTIGPVHFGVFGYFREKIDRLPGQKSYVILNAMAEYALAQSLTAGVSGHNLTQGEYRSLSEVLMTGVPTRGREVFATLRWTPGATTLSQ